MPNSLIGPRSSGERPRIAGVHVADHAQTANSSPLGLAGRRAALAGVVVFFLLFSGGLGVIRALPTTYAATTVISIMPRPGSGMAADTVQLAGKKYVVIATSVTTLEATASAVGVAPDQLSHATSAVLDAGTGNVEITVNWRDRQQAVNAANAIASVLVRRSMQDLLVLAEATSPAVESRAEVKPARTLLVIASGLAAALAAVLAWAVVKARLRPRREGQGSTRLRVG